jgi:hypothetical protein
MQKESSMKIVKSLVIAIAVMSIPITLSQRAFSQAPEIDSTPSTLQTNSSGTLTIYGENLNSVNGIYWWSDVCVDVPGDCDDTEGGVSYDVQFLSVIDADPNGYWITVSYTVLGGDADGYDLGSVYVTSYEGEAWGPDISVGP